MKAYKNMNRDELLTLKESLEKEFKVQEAKGLSLNMARGKPGASQLILSMPMLDTVNSQSDMNTLLGNDTRNYGDNGGVFCDNYSCDEFGNLIVTASALAGRIISAMRCTWQTA